MKGTVNVVHSMLTERNAQFLEVCSSRAAKEDRRAWVHALH